MPNSQIRFMRQFPGKPVGEVPVARRTAQGLTRAFLRQRASLPFLCVFLFFSLFVFLCLFPFLFLFPLPFPSFPYPGLFILGATIPFLPSLPLAWRYSSGTGKCSVLRRYLPKLSLIIGIMFISKIAAGSNPKHVHKMIPEA